MFYSIKYHEIQALALSLPFFGETETERPPAPIYSAQVYTTTIYLKIIICSQHSTHSQEQYELSLGDSWESRGVFMRALSFKCNLQCDSLWIIFNVTCILKTPTCSSLYIMIRCHQLAIGKRFKQILDSIYYSTHFLKWLIRKKEQWK